MNNEKGTNDEENKVEESKLEGTLEGIRQESKSVSTQNDTGKETSQVSIH